MVRPTSIPALKAEKLDLSTQPKPHPLAPREKEQAPVSTPAKTGEGTAMLAGRVPVTLRNQLKAKAATNGLTVAEVLEQLAKNYVEN